MNNQHGAHPPDTLDRVITLAQERARVAAEQYELIDTLREEAVLAARRPGGMGMEMLTRSLRLELALALQTTESVAENLLAHAEALVHRYPTVLAALRRGETTERHVQLLIDAIAVVEPELLPNVVPATLDLATSLPVGSFRRALRRLVDTTRVRTLPERHTDALTHRRVSVEHTTDGMAWLTLHLPAVEAHAAYDRITRMGKTILTGNPDDPRTLDQVRADITADLLIDGTVPAHPTTVRGIRATVAVTVPALTLLEHPGHGPAIVEGVGPIPLDRARELCGTTDGWMRVLTHPETGMVLSVGRDLYRPPASLRRLLQWRSTTCMAPGCTIPAHRCEIDHQTPWEHGGHTSLENTTPLCTGHHTIKHHGQWAVHQLPHSGGIIEWTSPLGRHYLVQPTHPTPTFHPEPEHETAPF